jgi:AcrR family transcriptional regulator
MTKGAETKQTIVDQAMRMAAVVGLEGLSLGELATELGLSKSGLYAHFRSKENLQIEAIRRAADLFVQAVVVPAIKKPRGEPRVQALFDNWMRWAHADTSPGGCFFVAAAAEMDDRPGGPVREALVQTQKDWLAALAQAARIAIDEGHFRRDLDPEQFAFETYALMLGSHHHRRLLRDPRTEKRSRASFQRLLDDARRIARD